ncbi:hypothetical protein V8C42DRAFT_318683 [Trichoderma barbatum]
MPLVPEPFDRLKERDSLSQIAKQRLRFYPVVDIAAYKKELRTEQIQTLGQRASRLCRRAKSMRSQESSKFSWEVCAWHDVFGLILDDEWFTMDKRKYKFVEKDADGAKIVKKRIPDATFGLTTYDSSALQLNEEFTAAGFQADYSNKQPDDLLSQDRLRSMMHNPMCSLVVDGAWGEANIAFPFAVYEAKKRIEDYGEARRQIQHACQIYLSMLDDLARKPDDVSRYQTKKSPPCQMFAFVSHGSRWEVYVAWSSFETCNIESLWHGDVTSPTSALNLICIVDQIHDYAVKHHRPTVLNHLSTWLTWSEKLEHRDGPARLTTSQPNWWCLESDMSRFRRKRIQERRNRKRALSEIARVIRSRTQREAKREPKFSATRKNGCARREEEKRKIVRDGSPLLADYETISDSDEWTSGW